MEVGDILKGLHSESYRVILNPAKMLGLKLAPCEVCALSEFSLEDCWEVGKLNTGMLCFPLDNDMYVLQEVEDER